MRSIGKAALALAVTAALLPVGAAPALAAGSSCTYSRTTRTVTVTITGDTGVMIERSGEHIRAGGEACLGLLSATTFVSATVTTTDRIRVTGDAGDQFVYIRLDTGRFAPGVTDEAGGSDEIEFTIDVGSGNDMVTILHASEDRDIVRFGTAAGAPAANLNANEGTGIDGDVTTSGVDRFATQLGGGNDIVSGIGGKGTGTTLVIPWWSTGAPATTDRSAAPVPTR